MTATKYILRIHDDGRYWYLAVTQGWVAARDSATLFDNRQIATEAWEKFKPTCPCDLFSTQVTMHDWFAEDCFAAREG